MLKAQCLAGTQKCSSRAAEAEDCLGLGSSELHPLFWPLREILPLSLSTLSSCLNHLPPALDSSPSSPPRDASLVLQICPKAADPLPCPLGAAGVMAAGPRPPRPAPSHLPQQLPWPHLGPTKRMEMDAKAPLFAEARRLSLRSPCVVCHQKRTSLRGDYSIRACFYLHLSSLIAFEWV